MPTYTRVSRLKEVPGIGVNRMSDAADAAHDPEMLRLENMDTDLPPPQIAIDATREAIDRDENNSYLPFFGQHGLRKAVMKRIHRFSGVDYDWKSECIITAGGMSGILDALLALLEPGDEVIVTDPVYAGIINRIRIAGGVTVFVPLIPTAEGWRLDLDALENAASPRTRLVLMSPGFPTGHVLSLNEWQAVARLCIEHDLWLLYDAALERILYDGRVVIHPAALPGMKERTITVGSATKELRMIGWRVGWVVGPQELIDAIGLVSISNTVCQVGIGMPGVAAALNADDDGLEEALHIWQQRRDCLLKELDGLPVSPPHGGWSLLLDAEALGMSSQEASQKLFKHAKIAATPMIGWGPQAAKYLRFVFANEPVHRLLGVGIKAREALFR